MCMDAPGDGTLNAIAGCQNQIHLFQGDTH